MLNEGGIYRVMFYKVIDFLQDDERPTHGTGAQQTTVHGAEKTPRFLTFATGPFAKRGQVHRFELFDFVMDIFVNVFAGGIFLVERDEGGAGCIADFENSRLGHTV